MAPLLRQGSRRIGGSVLQRAQAAVTSPAVAEERRRLVPRRMYRTEKGAGKDAMDKERHERRLRFKKIDAELTKFVNGVAGMYCIYAVLVCGDTPYCGLEGEGAQTVKKQEQ
ncbi:hypothetical protein ACQ4PT_021165 [Festuca glaucescens]